MIVFSPLSLYTTYLGWQQYEIIFNALWQTGLLFLGFLMVAFRFLESALALPGSTTYAAERALNTFLYELAITFLICGLFVYPCVPLEEKAMSFKPMCGIKKDSDVKSSTLKDTGTTYDEAFADVLTPNVKMPIGFAILQNYMSGLTYGLMKVTGCTDSLQSIEGDLISTYLPADVREQALNFHRQCFLEARSSYYNEKHDKAKVDEILKKYGGEEDLKWIGSKVFQTLYYNTIYARQPVPGFSFNEAPNKNLEKAAERGDIDAKHLPEQGYPSCNQWWSKLRNDLVQVANNASVFDSHLNYYAVLDRVRTFKNDHPKAWGCQLSSEDYIAKMLLNDSRDMQANSVKNMMDNTNGAFGGAISHGLINIGQWTKSWTSTPLKREAIMQTLPVMQAFLYFFIIIMTPVVLALSGYNPKALGSICGLFITAIFLQYLWHLVGFVERSVLDPLGQNDAVSAMRNMAVLFYFIGPMLLLKLSSHFGGEAGAVLGALVNEAGQQSDKVANSASDTIRQGAKIASAGKT
ncbi:conjugal transfer protein TraG N-terminal domain-containing protein [Legionella sp. 16cNR16C]|uniref:conjugal transfer protein TraG N-terminal domain-containing protein n=1 Tax=Legionella sp. 16cNR16C TaxID=2905656 RepID=UPI001E585896|nr:conjugal transfer protein TraG N-terminal domain-containing protein [Legionella sp. 16cNR16C]MCE3045374.1 conjugal transfer protein TraG N-terminal domain-containing protein [Legionella sp. 16cNR16C]